MASAARRPERRAARRRDARAEPGRRLPRAFYDRRPEVVARALLGRLLVAGRGARRVAGRIVEVEAYAGRRDAASHAWRGETPRNRTMFGAPGHLYVYLSYGLHACLNVVTGPGRRAGAVLIRALRPEAGLARMRRRRGHVGDHRLARGPGCVARALGLTTRDDGLDLVRGRVWIAARPPRRDGRRIARGPRIGISRATARRWRFFLAGEPSVSGPRTGAPGAGRGRGDKTSRRR